MANVAICGLQQLILCMGISKENINFCSSESLMN